MIGILAAALALRSPALTYRWVYVATNLLVPANEVQVERLLERAKKAGYNGVVLTDSKFERLAGLPASYSVNVRKLADKARELGIQIIPVFADVGWADGLLSSNPNLAESQPVRGVVYQVHGREATLVPDPQAAYRNGGFEDASGDQLKQIGFQDLPGQETFVDHQVFHSGGSSLRMTDPKGNCRLMEEIQVTPHRQYHFSVWAKTSGLDSQFEIKALDANSQAMSEQNPGVKKDQDWTQAHMTFNSGDSKVARIYMGFWGGQHGSIWLDDAALEEVGLLNVVRRTSCPVTVRGEDGTIYAEGKDYEAIADPKMGNVPWPGSFEVYHSGHRFVWRADREFTTVTSCELTSTPRLSWRTARCRFASATPPPTRFSSTPLSGWTPSFTRVDSFLATMRFARTAPATDAAPPARRQAQSSPTISRSASASSRKPTPARRPSSGAICSTRLTTRSPTTI